MQVIKKLVVLGSLLCMSSFVHGKTFVHNQTNEPILFRVRCYSGPNWPNSWQSNDYFYSLPAGQMYSGYCGAFTGMHGYDNGAGIEFPANSPFGNQEFTDMRYCLQTARSPFSMTTFCVKWPYKSIQFKDEGTTDIYLTKDASGRFGVQIGQGSNATHDIPTGTPLAVP